MAGHQERAIRSYSAAIEALVDLRDAVAKSKGQFPSACRVPDQGSGRGGFGNANGEKGVVRQSGLPELSSGLGIGNSRSGEVISCDGRVCPSVSQNRYGRRQLLIS